MNTGPFCTMKKLVLASASPRRQSFLRDQGLDFEILCPKDAEPRPQPGESPARYAARASAAKAQGAANMLGPVQETSYVLAADTIVVLDSVIFGKPENPAHALAMLEKMAGRSHKVITACCLLEVPAQTSKDQSINLGNTTAFHDTTLVSFAPWPRQALQAYVDTKDPMDKAGAYGIQGHGAFLISRLQGSWTNVAGLPLDKIIGILLQKGIIAPMPENSEHASN